MKAHGQKTDLRTLAGRIWRPIWTILPILLCILLLSSPEAALAQTASFRSVDKNSDGTLSYNELVEAFGRDGANRLLRSSDHNGDGRLTIRELRRGADRGGRDDSRPSRSSNGRDKDRDRDRDRGNDRDDDRDDRDDDDDDRDEGDGDDD